MLCDWFLNNINDFQAFKNNILFYQADATRLLFESNHFDLIATYSFLTRMSRPLRFKVTEEWRRILKKDGLILTSLTVATNPDSNIKHDFRPITTTNIDLAVACADEIQSLSTIIDRTEMSSICHKVMFFLNNMTRNTISKDELDELFSQFGCYTIKDIVKNSSTKPTMYHDDEQQVVVIAQKYE